MYALTRTAQTGQLPTPLDGAIERRFHYIAMRLDPMLSPIVRAYSLAAADAPSEDLRVALAARCDAIDGWLAPAGPERAVEFYDGLMETMAHKEPADVEAATLRAKLYVRDMADVPLFALGLAVRDFRRGAVGDGKWMPEPGVLRVEAMKRVSNLAKERREIQAVLTAEIRPPPLDPSRKAELLEATYGWIKGVKAAEAVGKRRRMTPDEIAQAKAASDAIDAGRPDPRPMPTLSPYLRQKYGLPETRDEAAA